MLLTDDFVYIHMPKTGGTFVAEVVSRLYGVQVPFMPSCLEAVFRKFSRGLVNENKHGTCSQIPESHRDRPILATVRNPYDRYVSQYEFGYWRRHPTSFQGIGEQANSIYPHYPGLSFPEFFEVLDRFAYPEMVNSSFSTDMSLGCHTKQLVMYFFKHPREVFFKIDEDYIRSRRYRHDLFENIHFIRTSELNRELYDFLLRFWPQRKLEFILAMEKILPAGMGRSEEQAWEKYYTPELKRKVRIKERIIFDLFPEFDV